MICSKRSWKMHPSSGNQNPGALAVSVFLSVLYIFVSAKWVFTEACAGLTMSNALNATRESGLFDSWIMKSIRIRYSVVKLGDTVAGFDFRPTLGTHLLFTNGFDTRTQEVQIYLQLLVTP